ncbi:protein of unknown function [Xenorhabdus doucetiae]|uniref:Uncharacterized protein n=1 Tax=Xenorhabdus doucetiae TaxID=351671 RepID=A0A068QXW5_9GAMM|nr:protein of unknown function [Xenorhabdus doucetiae]
MNILRPFDIVPVDQVMFEVSEKHKHKQDEHHRTGKRMQYP